MLEYATTAASIFHAIRLDNAHSTPIHVAQRIFDACREVRPNIYILAELFTGDEGFDNLFINSLGISSLVRGKLANLIVAKIRRNNYFFLFWSYELVMSLI